MISVVADKTPGTAYWVARVIENDLVYVVHVLDRHDLTLATVAAAAKGPVNAGDRWCRACDNRIRHDWMAVDGVIRCVCTRCHQHAPEDR